MEIIFFLTLLCLLATEIKNKPEDGRNPIGNYIEYFFEIIGKFLQKNINIKLPLPIIIHTEFKDEFVIKEYNLGKWIFDIITCRFCFSFWFSLILIPTYGFTFAFISAIYFILLKKVLAKI